jgi:hypothetical protein
MAAIETKWVGADWARFPDCDRVRKFDGGAATAASLLMIRDIYQAYVDDSGRGQEPVFVLAGFLATPAQWETFSHQWADALQSTRPLKYFKMREAAALHGEFAGWQKDERDELLLKLIDVIDRNVSGGICSVIRFDDWRKVLSGRFSRTMDTPYLMSYSAVMSAAYSFQLSIGGKKQIHFVFDEHGQEIGKVVRGWKEWIKFAHPRVKAMIGSPPQSGG